MSPLANQDGANEAKWSESQLTWDWSIDAEQTATPLLPST